MKTKTKNWIKPGALCNCNGEGSDTLIIRAVDKEKERASVCVFREDTNLSLKQAQEQWQCGFYCWESFDKLHQEWLSVPAQEFNLVKQFGLKKLNATPKPSKLIQMPCPEDIEATLLKHFNIRQKQYLDAGFGVYIGAYLSEKILKIKDDNLNMAVGRIVGHVYVCGMETVFSGYQFDANKQIALLIESLYVDAETVEHFVKTIDKWSNEIYYQSVSKTIG